MNGINVCVKDSTDCKHSDQVDCDESVRIGENVNDTADQKYWYVFKIVQMSSVKHKRK